MEPVLILFLSQTERRGRCRFILGEGILGEQENIAGQEGAHAPGPEIQKGLHGARSGL